MTDHTTPEPAVSAAGPATPTDTDPTGLRQRIAETLHQDQTPPPTVPWVEEAPMDREYFLRRADAVLAVLPAPVDRAAVLRETADRFERDPHTIQMFGHQVAALLRRMADETASSAPSGPRPTTTGAERAKVLSEIIGRITGAPTEDSITEDAPATLVLAVLEDLLAEQHSTAAAQPAGADVYEQTTGHLATCLAVAGGTPDPDCPCTRAAAPPADETAATETPTEEPICSDEPPRDGTWGDCWCTLPPGHDGQHRCQPCTDRHGAPGWTDPAAAQPAGGES